MSSEPYTPTVEVVRDAVTFPRERLGEPRPISGEAFERFLAKVRADALREAADKADADPEFRDPLRLKSDWLRERAERIEEEA